MLKFDGLGDSESILRNKRYLKETVQRLMRRGIVPQGMAGMDGSAAIRRRSATRRSASNANDSRNTLSARGRRDHGR